MSNGRLFRNIQDHRELEFFSGWPFSKNSLPILRVLKGGLVTVRRALCVDVCLKICLMLSEIVLLLRMCGCSFFQKSLNK
ncbi:hypothetical protein J1N35_013461, partial [Gossypium stocksii]